MLTKCISTTILTYDNSKHFHIQKVKYEEPHSPYTDKFDDDDSSHNYSGNDSRIASYVPQQKPEWKRYKQYTRSDIMAAIECVRNGMSALQASRQYKVPSRTLYDKVKKLGITAGRPMNRTIKRSPSNNGSSAFPFGISGTRSPYPHTLDNQSHSQGHTENENGGSDADQRERKHLASTIPHPAAALLDATFLQQALEARGGDIAGREALHAMALAAAAHAAVNGMSTSPGTGTARSPSPSVLMKYMRPPSPSNNSGSEQESNHQSSQSQSSTHHLPLSLMQQQSSVLPQQASSVQDDDDDDQVEDLSMSKKEKVSRSASASPALESPQCPSQSSATSPVPPIPLQTGVIVPPISSKAPASNSKEENLPVNIKHELSIDEN